MNVPSERLVTCDCCGGPISEVPSGEAHVCDACCMKTHSFPSVLAAELKEVERSRKLREVQSVGQGGSSVESAWKSNLTGLAFSGGGIRSASFNLGVLQALAKHNWLKQFDYISTVSGGGYISGWLAAWLTRRPAAEVQEALSSDWEIQTDSDRLKRRPIQFLRTYSNYLTARRGFVITDIWALVSVYVRNLLFGSFRVWVNLAIVAALLASLLLVPILLVGLSEWLLGGLAANWAFDMMGAAGMILLTFSVILIARNLAYFFSGEEKRKIPWTVRSVGIYLAIVCPLMTSAWLLSLFFSVLGRLFLFAELPAHTLYLWQYWIGFGAAGYGASWALAGIVKGLVSGSESDRLFWMPAVAFAFVAGALGGLLLRAVALTSVFSHAAAVTRIVSFGPPLLMLAFLITAEVHIGLIGLAFPSMKREWMAKLGGLLLVSSLAWAGLFVIVIYDPFSLKSFWLRFLSTGRLIPFKWSWRVGEFMENLPKIAGIAGQLGLSATWLLSMIGGAIAGRSAKTSGNQWGWSELLLRFSPFAFAMGSMFAVSLVVQTQLPHIIDRGNLLADSTFPEYLNGYWNIADVGELVICAAAMFSIALVLSWRVDVNEFSVQALYRNRLVRCFLGASNGMRHPHPFTGFDLNDDIRLTELRNMGKQTYYGPYPILNATLNLVCGEELAWRKRKAASFAFTPLFCGWDYTPIAGAAHDSALDAAGYRLTDAYACGRKAERHSLSLGTAMAVSGAAASRNMGYHSSPPVAFLMTLADVRLGWWAPNPANKHTWQSQGPKLGLLYLCRELFGLNDEKSGYVYLSDGGHFENLSIYELVRRQCRFILACDATDDKELHMEDLMNALEKCRVDFGVEITIDISRLKLDADSHQSKANFAQGTIKYAAGKEGTLLYLKATRTGKEPEPINSYAALNTEFPHDSTSDQWFDESRFENYRSLGYYIADEMCRALSQFPPACRTVAAGNA